ncbi:MAG: hypothetical protein JWO56_230 [Acidobacteria bacterium]|nr:hypothetical protein [Acidobacteriota bacterium]
MSFILRILFSGLIGFVPSQDGKEVTVLLLNVNQNHHVSDGTLLNQHKPLLLARAGACSGQCPTRDSAVAQFIYGDKSLAAALDSLEAAVTGGGAWQLAGSELSVRKSSATAADLPALVIRDDARGTGNGHPQTIPTTSAEREDYSWIADMKQINANGFTMSPDVLASQPPATIAARLRLRSGKVFTYSVARIGSNVTPVHFERLDGTGSASPYSQAIATWVGADLQISGDSVDIVEEKFDGGSGRSMTLSPDADGKVEVAVLNLPPFVPPASPANNLPEVGKHFEMYYELAQTPPASETRLVPRAGAAAGVGTYPVVEWQTIHPQTELWSDLLNQLRLDAGRGPYDRLLCPPYNNNYP